MKVRIYIAIVLIGFLATMYAGTRDRVSEAHDTVTRTLALDGLAAAFGAIEAGEAEK